MKDHDFFLINSQFNNKYKFFDTCPLCFFFITTFLLGQLSQKKINVVLFRNEEEKIQILVLIDLKHFYKTNQQTDNVCLKKVL